MVRVLHWNGKDLPEELHTLPPGEYVVEPVESNPPPPTEEEEAGLRRGLASAAAGHTVSHADVRSSVDKILGR